MKLMLGADISEYQQMMTESLFKQMVDAGLSFVIFKVQSVNRYNKIFEDPQAQKYKSWCVKYGVPHGIYVYVYPGVSLTAQVNFTNAMTKKYNPAITYMDIEEHKNYYTNLSYPGDWLSRYYKEYYDRMEGEKSIYTGKWFIDRYTPQSMSWIKDVEHTWWAEYLKYDWRWTYFLYTIRPMTLAKLPLIIEYLQGKAPTVPNGIWSIWQFITNMGVKEMTDVNSWLLHFDWNIMPEYEYIEIFKGATPPPPPPVPTTEKYKVLQTLVLRTGAGYFYPRANIAFPYLLTGDIIEVDVIVNGYAHLVGGNYCAAGERYIRKIA